MDQVTGKPGGAKTAADHRMNKQPADFSMRLLMKIAGMKGRFVPVFKDLPDGSKEWEKDTKTKDPGDAKRPVAG